MVAFRFIDNTLYCFQANRGVCAIHTEPKKYKKSEKKFLGILYIAFRNFAKDIEQNSLDYFFGQILRLFRDFVLNSLRE